MVWVQQFIYSIPNTCILIKEALLSTKTENLRACLYLVFFWQSHARFHSFFHLTWVIFPILPSRMNSLSHSLSPSPNHSQIPSLVAVIDINTWAHIYRTTYWWFSQRMHVFLNKKSFCAQNCNQTIKSVSFHFSSLFFI